MTQLTKEDIARRRPVWDALSELFLDTETRPCVGLAAAACLASGYADDELEFIWRHEVSPVLAPNLLCVAGEWAGIDLDWLEAQIVERRRGLFDGAAAWVNKEHWAEVCRLITWLRAWPEPRRDTVARALYALVWIALDGVRTKMPADTNLTPDERLQVWEEAAAPLLTALHVKGYEPPLNDALARGRAGLDP